VYQIRTAAGEAARPASITETPVRLSEQRMLLLTTYTRGLEIFDQLAFEMKWQDFQS
jgi:hypothetical protein